MNTEVVSIGILTLPLGRNVGGVLQAYALNNVLSNMGFRVETIDNQSEYHDYSPLIRLYHLFVTYKQRRFIKRYLKQSSKQIRNSTDFDNLPNTYNTIIVGSDQVWRLDYTRKYFKYYFLDFNNTTSVRKIAYAASTGVSKEEWLSNINQSEISYIDNCLRECLKDFDAISVREKTGIDICNWLGCNNVCQVVDPTMLIDKKEYAATFNIPQTKNHSHLVTYILDSDPDKNNIITHHASQNNLIIKNINSKQRFKDLISLRDFNLNHYMFPDIEKWLFDMYNADFIITDSFHGAVFAIIFNKDFIVISNSSRGKARFESLLSKLELNDRLIDNYEDYQHRHWEHINYQRVNHILSIERNKSIEFLQNALNTI